MSRAQDPHCPAFHFGSTFRKMFPKGSSMPSELAALLDEFERTLANRVRQLMPAGGEKTLHLSWMIRAMEQLSVIHTDVKKLSTALGLPVSNWKDKWIEVYFDDTVKLLDVSNAFIEQIHMLEQTQRYLVCALGHLSKSTPEGLCKARSSIDQWTELISLRAPSLAQCCSVLDGFRETHDHPKTADKEKVLIRALYGFKVVTRFVCRVFAAVFSGSAEELPDIKVASVYLWAGAFGDLQTAVNTVVRSSGKAIALEEVKAIGKGVNRVYTVLRDGVEGGGLANMTSDLRKSAEDFSRGLELLSKEVDSFFKMLLSRRNALTGRLRVAFDMEKGEKKE